MTPHFKAALIVVAILLLLALTACATVPEGVQITVSEAKAAQCQAAGDGAFDEMPVSLGFVNQRYPHLHVAPNYAEVPQPEGMR